MQLANAQTVPTYTFVYCFMTRKKTRAQMMKLTVVQWIGLLLSQEPVTAPGLHIEKFDPRPDPTRPDPTIITAPMTRWPVTRFQLELRDIPSRRRESVRWTMNAWASTPMRLWTGKAKQALMRLGCVSVSPQKTPIL